MANAIAAIMAQRSTKPGGFSAESTFDMPLDFINVSSKFQARISRMTVSNTFTIYRPTSMRHLRHNASAPANAGELLWKFHTVEAYRATPAPSHAGALVAVRP